MRVDNEAVSVKWEIVESEEQQISEIEVPKKGEKQKGKGSKHVKDIPVDERRIFGEEVSDSEEEEEEIVREAEETRLSDDSRSHFSDSNSMMQMSSSQLNPNQSLVTEFAKKMFDDEPSTSSYTQYEEYSEPKQSTDRTEVNEKINEIRKELNELRQKQIRDEQEIQTIDNKKLKERLQDNLQQLLGLIVMKEMELDELTSN